MPGIDTNKRQHRRVVITAISLGLVALGIYLLSILLTGT